MDPPTFPYTEDELNKAGLLGEGVSERTTQVLKTMREHPELLKLSLFTLQCINKQGQQRKGPSSPRVSDTPALSDVTAVSLHGPDKYEIMSYYNGIAGDGGHPYLVYRSDSLTTPFPRPVGGHIPVKSLRGVFDTPLNGVWDTVAPQICDVIKARKINWSSIDPVRFFTHAPLGEETKGSLGPIVIWVGVTPGSTSADTAHEVSQEILTMLWRNGVSDVVVEWCEVVVRRLSGSSCS